MNELFHIMIGAESGTLRSLTFTRKRFFIYSFLISLTLAILITASFFTVGLYSHNRILVNKMATTQKDLTATQEINNGFEERLATIKFENNLRLANIQLENTRLIKDLELRNIQLQTSFKDEKEELLSTTVNRLNERNKLIESVMDHLGLKIKKKKIKHIQSNSGGPYIALADKNFDELIQRTDTYLKTIRRLPLGRPVTGYITSRYGRRVDPLNDKKAFHSGIDFRGKYGDKIRATAHGKVVYAGRNGGFGKFIKIDHGNGYTTSFAHMKKVEVKKGQYVKQGQVIGRVGSSGRSTGPHLHYEISRNGKTINPYRFIKL